MCGRRRGNTAPLDASANLVQESHSDNDLQKHENFLSQMLLNYGVCLNVANKFGRFFSEYGATVGNLDSVESGAHYVYAKSWEGGNSGNEILSLSKYEYDSDETIINYSDFPHRKATKSPR